MRGKRSPLRRLVRRAGKSWLSWRYRHFSPDTATARHVRVAGLTLLLEPTVFHPNLHFTSGFLAEYLRQEGVVAQSDRVLDVGTGSGLLAISAALAGARQVMAVDLNPAAVLAARMNVSLYGLAGKVRVVHGDLFDPVAGEQFDLVVCNPPYLRGEPSSQGTLAYMAGEDFRWLRRFSQEAASYLTARGRCLLVLADSTDLKTVLKIFNNDGWSVRGLATRDMLVEHLFIVALHRPR
ncbi:MAG: methyltransferase [Chloroflexota bacterium]|nr:methyltransferase [Chloroflexota bacterium]MDQ5864162.1 methyltransferase [Chloroflexota bacterium]